MGLRAWEEEGEVLVAEEEDLGNLARLAQLLAKMTVEVLVCQDLVNQVWEGLSARLQQEEW